MQTGILCLHFALLLFTIALFLFPVVLFFVRFSSLTSYCVYAPTLHMIFHNVNHIVPITPSPPVPSSCVIIKPECGRGCPIGSIELTQESCMFGTLTSVTCQFCGPNCDSCIETPKPHGPACSVSVYKACGVTCPVGYITVGEVPCTYGGLYQYSCQGCLANSCGSCLSTPSSIYDSNDIVDDEEELINSYFAMRGSNH